MFFRNSSWKIEIHSSWLKLEGKHNNSVESVSFWWLGCCFTFNIKMSFLWAMYLYKPFTFFLLCGREWKKSIHDVWICWAESWSIDPVMWLPTRTPNKSGGDTRDQLCCALSDCNYYLHHSYKSIMRQSRVKLTRTVKLSIGLPAVLWPFCRLFPSPSDPALR